MGELTTSPTAGTAAQPRRAGRLSRIVSISLLRESPVGMIGAFLVLFWVTLAVLAPVLPLFDPLAQSPGFLLETDPDAGQGRRHPWLGTDELGRDVLSRLIWGSRLVLVWATLATTVAYAVGMIMGVVGGYRGELMGRDHLLLRQCAAVVPADGALHRHHLAVRSGIGTS